MTSRVRTAVLISGRGSNMVALIEAARSPGFSAEIVLVLSDDPGAAGLSLARNAGRCRRGDRFSSLCGQAGLRGGAPRAAHVRLGRHCLPRWIHARVKRILCRAMARTDTQHSSLAVAKSARPQDPRARARPRACRTWLHGSPRDRGTRRRSDPRSRRACPFFRGDAAALAARVLKEEHRIYPKALDEFARSVRDRAMTSGKQRRRRRATVKQAASAPLAARCD